MLPCSIQMLTVSHEQGIDLNVGELQMYGTVNWLNAGEELGKVKKGTELLTLLFIFKTGVVLMAQERTKGKRKPRVSSTTLHRHSHNLITAKFYERLGKLQGWI